MCRGADPSVSLPFTSLPTFPSPTFPSPSLEVVPLNPATGSGERYKLPQRVRAEPGRHTILGAFWAKNSPSGDNKFEEYFHETKC